MTFATVHALIPAAGKGERFGTGLPKQFYEISGKPVLAWALERLRAAGLSRFVVALAAKDLDRGAALLGAQADLKVVVGGASRQESVERCLAACAAAPEDLVLVHDGARAAVHPDDVKAVISRARRAHGAVLGRPVADTLKRLEEEHIVATESRASLFRAETPQVFSRQVLERACRRATAEGFAGTDEASLVERLEGARVLAVVARHPNPKITWSSDLPLLEALLRAADVAAVETEVRA